ncbi:MAG TPA: F0F1 ATP synthase subunit A [Phycisphaerales bacterium]|nr:F0F1 ATP synthase subunit A [Phycisphaerales bacterium]
MMDAVFTLAASNPVDHVVNAAPHAPWAVGKLFGMEGVWLWSSHVGTLLLAGLLTVIVLWWASTKIATGPESQGTNRYVTSNPFAHMIEVICLYLRDTTVRPLLEGRTDKFMPFLWTVFFFILINNILGLVPFTDAAHLIDGITALAQGKQEVGHAFSGFIGATATQNLFVTAALAIIAALVINFAGIRELGIGGYLHHLTAGTPFYLWPLMIPIEIMGTVIKPVALALRLFANMTAGHILVAVLFMFAVKGLQMLAGGAGGVVLGGAISIVSVVSAIAIYFLELFVAFLQAFVFMFLTTVFISQLSHHHEDHEHGGAHDHEHAHA